MSNAKKFAELIAITGLNTPIIAMPKYLQDRLRDSGFGEMADMEPKEARHALKEKVSDKINVSGMDIPEILEVLNNGD